jgi:hypothetical protein
MDQILGECSEESEEDDADEEHDQESVHFLA